MCTAPVGRDNQTFDCDKGEAALRQGVVIEQAAHLSRHKIHIGELKRLRVESERDVRVGAWLAARARRLLSVATAHLNKSEHARLREGM